VVAAADMKIREARMSGAEVCDSSVAGLHGFTGHADSDKEKNNAYIYMEDLNVL
jgi:hypothetical protein